ncbi:MAG: hypothetical protein ACREN8_13275, partial [Candidatus Dormibacteraceae bacterium]
MTRIAQRVKFLFSPVIDGGRIAVDRESAKLREEVDLKYDFLQLTIHELRRPLGLINGYLPMLLEGDYGPVPSMMRPGLEMIKGGASEMKLLIEGLVEIIYLEERT